VCGGLRAGAGVGVGVGVGVAEEAEVRGAPAFFRLHKSLRDWETLWVQLMWVWAWRRGRR